MPTVEDHGWRGVLVAPPDPLAGIGGALRRAFLADAMRPLHGFADLLARLDRIRAAAPGRRQ